MTHYNEATAGALSGVIGTILGFPLDAVKSRMQIYPSRPVGWIFQSIHAEDGWRSFYRGLASPLFSLVILNSMNFTLYSKFRQFYGQYPTSSPVMPTSANMSGGGINHGKVNDSFGAKGQFFDVRVLVAGASVGPFAAFVSTPFEFLKIQMQFNRLQVAAMAKASLTATNSHIQYKNTLHACTSIVKNYGVRPLFTGHAVNTAREMLFLSVYFGVYEHSKSLFLSLINSPALAIPIAGGISGALGWVLSYPLDCIKGNIQGVSLSAEFNSMQRKKTFINVAREIVGKNGFFWII
jgi:solute carrier family 25 (mitochondrial carnitine/acylcarnitine transporter), member 20/29